MPFIFVAVPGVGPCGFKIAVLGEIASVKGIEQGYDIRKYISNVVLVDTEDNKILNSSKGLIDSGVLIELPKEYESWQCQKCGEDIGYLGRFVEWIYKNIGLGFLVKHKCKNENH